MAALALVTDLIAALTRRDVPFVHWKSNEHLTAALSGDTDLDLLVDPAAREEFLAVVDDLGFVPMEPPRERAVEGMESFLGLDPGTAKLVHLDVQFRVVLGEQFLKNHHLPLERWLLSTPDTLEGMAVPRAEQELLVLYVRCALKTRSRQIVAGAVRRRSPLPGRIRKECRWLAERSDPDLLAGAVAGSGLEITPSELSEFRDRSLADRLDWRYVLDRKRSLTARLRRFQRLPWYRAMVRRIWLRLRTGRVLNAVGLGLPRRHLGFTAPVVAAVGADGSGKTRLTRDLEAWLGAKLVVHHVYFGQPKSGAVHRLLNKPGSMARNKAEAGEPAPVLSRLGGITDALKWLWLARRRETLARQARTWAEQGEVVIAERYPLSDFHDMEAPMDGPRLQPDGAFAGAEIARYRAIPEPDLTLILDTSVDVLRARKIDLTMDEHVAKVQAVERLKTGPGRVRIDAAQPYEDVLAQAKNRVWEALLARR